MKIFPIKAFSDNYIWLVEDNETLIIVDPGESNGVLDYLQQKKFNKRTILLTHNHEDHVGGVIDILENYPGTAVYGPSETQHLNTMTLKEKDYFEIDGHTFSVLKTN